MSLLLADIMPPVSIPSGHYGGHDEGMAGHEGNTTSTTATNSHHHASLIPEIDYEHLRQEAELLTTPKTPSDYYSAACGSNFNLDWDLGTALTAAAAAAGSVHIPHSPDGVAAAVQVSPETSAAGISPAGAAAAAVATGAAVLPEHHLLPLPSIATSNNDNDPSHDANTDVKANGLDPLPSPAHDQVPPPLPFAPIQLPNALSAAATSAAPITEPVAGTVPSMLLPTDTTHTTNTKQTAHITDKQRRLLSKKLRSQSLALLSTLDLNSRERALNAQGRRTLRDVDDEEYISPLNCLARASIEIFEVKEDPKKEGATTTASTSSPSGSSSSSSSRSSSSRSSSASSSSSSSSSSNSASTSGGSKTNKPVGQVGLRCLYCADATSLSHQNQDQGHAHPQGTTTATTATTATATTATSAAPQEAQAQAAAVAPAAAAVKPAATAAVGPRHQGYPGSISSIENYVRNFYRNHIVHCPNVPPHIMEVYVKLKQCGVRAGNKKVRYYDLCNSRLNLVDMNGGGGGKGGGGGGNNNGFRFGVGGMTFADLPPGPEDDEDDEDGMKTTEIKIKTEIANAATTTPPDITGGAGALVGPVGGSALAVQTKTTTTATSNGDVTRSIEHHHTRAAVLEDAAAPTTSEDLDGAATASFAALPATPLSARRGGIMGMGIGMGMGMGGMGMGLVPSSPADAALSSSSSCADFIRSVRTDWEEEEGGSSDDDASGSDYETADQGCSDQEELCVSGGCSGGSVGIGVGVTHAADQVMMMEEDDAATLSASPSDEDLYIDTVENLLELEREHIRDVHIEDENKQEEEEEVKEKDDDDKDISQELQRQQAEAEAAEAEAEAEAAAIEAKKKKRKKIIIVKTSSGRVSKKRSFGDDFVNHDEIDASEEAAEKKKKKKISKKPKPSSSSSSSSSKRTKSRSTDSDDEEYKPPTKKAAAAANRAERAKVRGRASKPTRHDGFTGSGKWTLEEDIKFEEAFKLYGKQWVLVAQHVETRSPNQCKSHNQKLEERRQKAKGA